MTKTEAVEKIYHTGLLHKLITNIGGSGEDEKDLEQDLYLSLMEKPEELLAHLAENEDELRYYLARMTLNQVRSKSSPYIQTYKAYKRKKSDEAIGKFNERLQTDK